MFDYKEDVENFCFEIGKCSQRGERVLSVVDLINAGTISVKQASFLLEKIKNESSFIVGALPSGGGKTTVMQALLCFLPPGIKIIHTENEKILERGKDIKKSCFLCHEIGAGHYYCYLWEESLLKFFQLKKYGHIIVSNIHADNLQQAKNQICYENPVPEELFYLVDLYIFLKVEGHGWNYKRKIDTIWVKEGNGLKKFNETEYKAKEKYLFFLQKTVSDNIFLIQDFRKEFLKTFYSKKRNE